MPELRGALQGQGLKIGIVVSHFNEFITSRLVRGAKEGLLSHGVKEQDITIAWVPGSFELPTVAKAMAKQGRWDALICLGAVIRGETAHFDFVAGEAARGIGAVARKSGTPVIYGVLTTNTLEQAMDRAGAKMGNKGYDSALAALEMVNLLRALGEPAEKAP